MRMSNPIILRLTPHPVIRRPTPSSCGSQRESAGSQEVE